MRALAVLVLGVLVGAAACRRELPEPPDTPAGLAAEKTERAHQPRLVVLGFDGVDPRRVDELVRRGKLPNVVRLAATGYRGPLRSTNPPQSPVAWATFATGRSPGEHGIFDFVERHTDTYHPELATIRMRHAALHGGRLTPATVENRRRGETFWDVIARAGIPALALRVPYHLPMPADGATAFAGLGAPDVRGTHSSYTLLTTDARAAAGPAPPGGEIAALQALRPGVWRAMIAGPTPTVDGHRQPTYAPIVVRAAGTGLRVEAGGTTQDLGLGETGRYLVLEFVSAPALRIRAATRVTVRRGAPSPEFYVEPLSIVPEAPYVSLAHPEAFGIELWRAFGPFKTVGWLDDTAALGAGVLDERQFLREALATMRLEGRMAVAALEARAHRLVIAVSTSTDRLGHMFYRYLDPLQRERPDDPALARALDDAYAEMDRTIGLVAAHLDAADTLLVVSDHGFSAFRRGFNVNTWLRQQGYLVLAPGVRGDARELFADVDWSRTRAFALGTGSIYLNVRGREAKGVVAPEEAPALARAIARALLAVRDGPGVRPVLAAYLGDDVYAGAARRAAPDVRLALADGYRASWATALGGAPAALFSDNTKKWSGDHASSRPEDVPGLLVSSRPIAVRDPGLEDLAVTAYRFFDVVPPRDLAGRAWFAEREPRAATPPAR